MVLVPQSEVSSSCQPPEEDASPPSLRCKWYSNIYEQEISHTYTTSASGKVEVSERLTLPAPRNNTESSLASKEGSFPTPKALLTSDVLLVT